MYFAKIFSAQSNLYNSSIIDVEVDISNGLHCFNIVGLADRAIEESKDRVSSAIKHAGFISPKQKNQKVVVSLAPADIKKVGPVFDLPIAISYLLASEQIKFDPISKVFIGELSLDGKIRKVCGVLPAVNYAKRLGIKEFYLPTENLKEASLVTGIKIFASDNLREIAYHLDNKSDFKMKPTEVSSARIEKTISEQNIKDVHQEKMSEIIGQESAKRGLLIALSGGHNIGFFGPPGTGKTLIAKMAKEFLPKLNYQEIIETTSIYSLNGLLETDFVSSPPFRSPHHTSSYSSIIGGGNGLKPGEITLAHNGILFLDEFPEFDRRVIESLRQPLEERRITIGRTEKRVTYPANFILIVAMNPCPCGYKNSTVKECLCTPQDISKYKKKISGPIVDRIDMWIKMDNIKSEKIFSKDLNTDLNLEYKNITKQIINAREKQSARNGKINKEINHDEIKFLCKINTESEKILMSAHERLSLSMRSIHKIIRLSRTIADLANSETIETSHVLEALQYRQIM